METENDNKNDDVIFLRTDYMTHLLDAQTIANSGNSP
jgi:hypothetical protein